MTNQKKGMRKLLRIVRGELRQVETLAGTIRSESEKLAKLGAFSSPRGSTELGPREAAAILSELADDFQTVVNRFDARVKEYGQ